METLVGTASVTADGGCRWHTRSGAPHCVTDLESVAAGQAQTIILLHPENTEVRPGSCAPPAAPRSPPLPLFPCSV